ncbi:hypothetical protein KPH14_005555 [Odynerus spinipes]|uniref:Ankyrin repeat domain-containing protein 54 n=1 Tax=Odynerus spinipes TaxID=1348599 RepID=A0AAD9RC06_9HYME|nr:hypothetical protein KPH14_005555 [Odynerus spinipes]
MTSVDSGVETGNDSNDSSIVQQENLTSGQISCNTTSTVATVNSSQREGQENDQNTFRIGFGPAWPVDLNLPISSLCPVLENYNYGDISQNSGASTSGELVVGSPQVLEFRLPASRFVSLRELRGTCCSRKMKSLHMVRNNHHYFGWKEFREAFMERKMRLAAYTNNTELMRRLLNTGVSPNSHDEQGRTPLHLASCRGYTAMVHLLLEHGADPNKRDIVGNTPLHLAAVTSKISVVTLLLKAGTNVLSLDKYGYSPLQIAQKKLRMLQHCKGSDMLKIKEEVHNIVSMLLAYLQKQKDTSEQVETLSTFCSRLSLSNTSDQVQDDVKDLLANINSLSITS